MRENKQITIKIISVLVLFLFVFSFLQNISTKKVEAIEITKNLNWDNPNKNGKNPYKLSTDAILNPQTMMSVVGCTGIVDKVSIAASGFLKDSLSKIGTKLTQKLLGKQLIAKYCAQGKGIAETSAAGIPTVLGNGVNSSAIQTAIKDMGLCNETKNVKDGNAEIENKKAIEIAAATKKRQECFDGLAYTLAKNQLTSMTRETINWINTGFNGDPMYVQNAVSFTNSIEKNVLDTGIAVLANGAFPYSDTFSKMMVNNYKGTHGVSNGLGFLDSLASDLSAFVTDTKSYTNTDIAGETMTARQRAQRANDIFSNDFSTGGWDAWNALTQRDQNNPLGFTMQASQYLSDRAAQQVNETKNELVQNNGFLSQKECVLWGVYDKENKMEFDYKNGDEVSTTEAKTTTTPDENDKCINWKVTTPGSMIKEKLATYINSPERQLEMAHGINDVLNNLFTKLIENFRSEGLFGLSQENYFDKNNNYLGSGGYGKNGTGYSSIEYNTEKNYGQTGYDENFDLTRDLGNTYIREDTRSLGKWDAKNNKTMAWNESTKKWEYDGGELNIGLGVWNEISNGYERANYYYTVEYAGSTKLFNEGYNGWAVGDRAFWDGKKWQNWKKDQTSPIDTRGIIQIQSDYIVAAKEILKILPGIMTKKGELDYCIPGPNPSYDTNSGETASLFMDYSGTLGGNYIPGKFFKRDATEIQVAQKGSQPYDDYKANITQGNTNVLFNKIAIIPEYDPLNSKYKKVKPANNIWQNIQMFLGLYKSDEKEDLIMEHISKLQTDIQKGISGFLSNYQTKVYENLYFKKMNPEFIENELNGELKENPSYLPILGEAYSFTNKMFEDDQNIKDAIDEYSDSIIQAQSNISRLNIIKSEVAKIIKAAQDRRDANLLEILNREAIDEKRTTPLTPEKYKEIYKDCLAEEQILYYDEKDIMKNSDVEKERCTDGLDNDLDGLIDLKDLDCKGISSRGGGDNDGTRGPNTTGGDTRRGGNGSISVGQPMKDTEGNTYNTIKIGDQTWMAENLRTTKFRNGDNILNIKDNDAWNNAKFPAWSDYDNDTSNGNTYGHLYNWYTVEDGRGIAPLGWHVPTYEDSIKLKEYLIKNGYNWPSSNTTDNLVAKSLASTTLWYPSNTSPNPAPGLNQSTNNSSGFNALPGGWRRNGNFVSLGLQSIWWNNSSELTSSLDYNMPWFAAAHYTSEVNYGHNIRLIKDN